MNNASPTVIPLVSYTKGEEILNTLTHAAGLILCGFIVSRCAVPAFSSGQALRIVCSLLYLTGTEATFVVSALYHGVKPGPAKRTLRLLDHCVIFFAVAGTATGCVPAVYGRYRPLRYHDRGGVDRRDRGPDPDAEGL